MLHREIDGKQLSEEEKRRIDRKKGYTAAVFFSVLVGFSFLGIKVSQPYADSLNILCYRYDFAFIVVVILMIAGLIKTDITNRPKGKLLLTAGFYVGFMALQVVGLVFATSVEGAIVFAIIPIIVKVIASIFLGEKSSWKENVFVGLSVSALLLMILMGAGTLDMDPLGAVLLMLSSVSMALSNVFMRYARNDCRPIEITVTIVTLGFIVFNCAAAVSSLINGEGFAPLRNPQVFIATAYLGIGCILLSAHLMSYMLSKMEAVKGTIFGNLSTAISIVAGVVILGEPLKWYHVVCTVLIIAGVIGLCLSGGKPANEEKEE